MSSEILAINEVHEGDCLELMKRIPNASVDMILCDLPYGTTEAAWDSIIPTEYLWGEYMRIIKENGVIVLTAQQPFSSVLVSSNPKMYKHQWVWIKNKCANFQHAKNQPLKLTEDVLVFSTAGFSYNAKNKATYNPQMTDAEKPQKLNLGQTRSENFVDLQPRPNPTKIKSAVDYDPMKRYPKNYIQFDLERKKEHPTQKPVALFEYLIRTYTNEGDTVLDNCLGSGTTSVAAINTNRNFIGIEREPEYVEIAKKRISDVLEAKEESAE